MTGTQTLLARHAGMLVTMDEARREIADSALFIRGNVMRDGHLATLDLGPHVERHNRLARQLLAA